MPFFNRRILAKQIGLPEDAIDMIENDVGGGFGARGEFYPEDFLIPFAARHLNRPVKWIEDRRENLMAMNHAREAEVDVEIACERDGTILALRGHAHVDMGAYMRTNGAVGARNIAQFMAGPYRIPDVKLDVSLWMTNKTPVGTYRGPGRFETDFFRERLFDMVAQDLGIDRVEFRRKNLDRACGDAVSDRDHRALRARGRTTTAATTSETLDRCLKEIGWAEKAKLQGKLIDGRYHGLAVGCFIEGGAAGPKETARLEINDDGSISVFMGSSAVGQGVETVFAQIAADALEIPMDRIRWVHHGSTAYVSDGYGAYHSRSMVMGGSALLDAANNFKAALREEAAKRLGCDASEITLGEDKVSGPGGKSLPLSDFAGLTQEGAFLNKKHTYSYGAQAAHVAVDPKIGHVELDRLRRGAGRRPHHQSADLARAGDRLAGAGARRRVPRASRLRRAGATADRLARRLSAADRQRLPEPARLRDGRASLADQSARRQGRRRGRHGRRRRRDRQRGRERAAVVQARPARTAADADARVGMAQTVRSRTRMRGKTEAPISDTGRSKERE